MANDRIKISQLTPKGANLASTDLLEISEYNGSGYITKSITGQEIIDAASGGGGDMLKSVYDPDDTGIVLSASKEMVSVINKTGGTINAGAIVYLKSTSSSATHPEILLADADTEATSTKTIGAVYEDILSDEIGYVVTSGEVDNLNTGMYNIGDKLWLSQIPGEVTTTPPVQPAHTVFIGTVTRSQGINGRILYAIQNGYELNELHNVLITSVANNDIIQYDSSTSLWKNESLSTAGIQPTLVSGTNIKTINGNTLLGSGDLTISGGSGLLGYSTIIPLTQYKVTTPAINASSPQTGAQANNRLSFIPYIPQNTYNAGAFYINCTTLQAGAIGRILVYSDSNGKPYQKLYESTDLSLATAGQKLIETPFTFTAGTTYWISYHNQGTATISVIPAAALPVISIGNSGSTTPVSHYYLSAAIGSAPSTITSINEWTGNAPLVFIIKY